MRGFFMQKKALFVGLTTVDIQFFVDEFPSPNQKIKTEPPHVNVGGPAANAAVTFSFLGGKSCFLTSIGKNPFSGFINDELTKHKIDVVDFTENECIEPVIASVITSSKSGDRSIISHFPHPSQQQNNKVSNLNFDEFDLVFIDGFYPELAFSICKKARKMKLKVVFDGGSWKPGTDQILQYVDYAICSEQFIPPGCTNFSEVAHYLNRNGITNIAVTRGEKSILWSENQRINSINVPGIDTKDTLGAGDIFHGAFIWNLLENDNFELALIKASEIASFSTCYEGTREWMKEFHEQF
jgi:sugar/nucleoside kinase (ribokinase family)